MPPEMGDIHASRLVGALRNVGWRISAADLLAAWSAAAVVATVVAGALAFTHASRSRAWTIALTVGLAAGFAVAWRRRAQHGQPPAALRIERRFPDLRNLLVTAQELVAHPDRASEWMRAHVLACAAGRIETLDLSSAVPLRKGIVLATAALAVLVAAAAGIDRQVPRVALDVADRALTLATGRTAVRLVVDLQPPAYLGTKPVRLVDPERVEAVEGTVLRLTLTGGEHSDVRFGTTPLEVRPDGQTRTAQLLLERSGYLAIQQGNDEAVPVLIPVTVHRDAAPAVRIDTPARDLLLPHGRATVDVAASASDDFGLQALELRYTKVSGSGEQFEFEEGTLPLDVRADDPRSWRGRARVGLAALKLEPGDALVYRAVARDRRPGARLASSDTFYVEILGPGQVPVEGVDLPPEQERYALSQQMVVLKIERLRTREKTMMREAIVEESANIAAEQRAVRANFIFLMGGHVEDEEEEAAQSHEIQEGRLENSARREITTAIRHMTRAEQGLTALDTGAALPPARAAVDALQRAFGQNRYILRAMPVRSRIDPSRRLTGDSGDGADWRRDVPDAAGDSRAREARALLRELLATAATRRNGGAIDRRQLAALAERAIALDPTSVQWQAASGAIGEARLEDAIAVVAVFVRAGALPPPPAAAAPSSRLESAWMQRRR